MFYFFIFAFSQIITPSLLTPIRGGNVVKNEGFIKYPFMVSLQQRYNKSQNFYYEHFCGGSLLSSEWILTSAHCLWKKNITNVFAVIGQENIRTITPEQRLATVHVEYFHYEPASLRNDIALLRLQRPYKVNDHYKEDLYGKLAEYGMKPCVKNPCKIIGFGATSDRGSIQEQLNEAELNIISNVQCRSLIGRVWAPEEGDNTVCALGTSQDSCQGDSGGPLLCKYNDEYYIYGIVSYGQICSLNGMPGIYTLTGPYSSRINMQLNTY